MEEVGGDSHGSVMVKTMEARGATMITIKVAQEGDDQADSCVCVCVLWISGVWGNSFESEPEFGKFLSMVFFMDCKPLVVVLTSRL